MPAFHPVEVSSLDPAGRLATFHHHRHPNRPPTVRFYGTQDSYAGPGADPGCLPLNRYSGTVRELLDEITSHVNASVGSYIALVASEQQPASLTTQGTRVRALRDRYGPAFHVGANVWHNVVLYVIHIPASELPNTTHNYRDLGDRNRNRRNRNNLVDFDPDDEGGDGNYNADIRRLFVYDPSYPNFGINADQPRLTDPGQQPRQSRV